MIKYEITIKITTSSSLSSNSHQKITHTKSKLKSQKPTINQTKQDWIIFLETQPYPHHSDVYVRSILRIREIHSRKFSLTSWQLCESIQKCFDNDKEKSFEESSSFIHWSCNIRTSSNFFIFEAANFFNWSMHFCELTDHMPNFSNANRMMISLNVYSRIWLKSLQNLLQRVLKMKFR
jgi:hypothetical protein